MVVRGKCKLSLVVYLFFVFNKPLYNIGLTMCQAYLILNSPRR